MIKERFGSRQKLLALSPLLLSFVIFITRTAVSAEGNIEPSVEELNIGTHDAYEPGQLKNENVCKIYLAQSSISGAGLGIYSAIDLSEGDVVTSDDLPIQVVDFRLHNDNREFDWLLDSYYWSSHGINGHHEAAKVATALPSFGMAGNGHPALVNVDKSLNKKNLPILLERSKSPGAGAVSDYPTVSWYATKTIKKGEEIFLDYGENYFESRPQYENMPFTENYDEADRIAGEMKQILEKDGQNNSNLQNYWNLLRSATDTKTSAALPEDVNYLDDVVEKGSARFSLPDSIRSNEWLENNGQCMDNIRVDSSSLPDAGRGAFANRFIPKGSLVAPAPLVQITDRNVLNMYFEDHEFYHEDIERYGDYVVGKQLLLNYCFGNKKSSLLLFPFSTAVQCINHKSDANAEIQWSSNPYHHAHWLDISVEEIGAKQSGLMFDIVATKDIYPDDEVFINYGEEWEHAWRTHVEKWEPAGIDYVRAEELNLEYQSAVRTLEEQENNPYPSTIETGCFYYRDPQKLQGYYEEDLLIIDMDWYYDGEFEDLNLRPCHILQREEDEVLMYNYTVEILNHGESELNSNSIPENEYHRLHNVPHYAIWYLNKRYTSNQHLSNAFRHNIGISDRMIPAAWRNR